MDELKSWLDGIAKSRGISVSEIARSAGISASTLTRFVSGAAGSQSLRRSTIEKIERTFGVAAPVAFATGLKRKVVQENAVATLEIEIEQTLLTEARLLKVDVEDSSRRAVRDAVRDARMRKWAEDNRAALEAKVNWIERHGLWSDGLRLF